MSNIDVEPNGADENASAEIENGQSTKTETVSNLKFELVTETDRSLSLIVGLGEPVVITELNDDQLTTRCHQLGEFFKVLSGRMTLHTA